MEFKAFFMQLQIITITKLYKKQILVRQRAETEDFIERASSEFSQFAILQRTYVCHKERQPAS